MKIKKIDSFDDLCVYINKNRYCLYIDCSKCPVQNMKGKCGVEATLTKECDCKDATYDYRTGGVVLFFKQCNKCGKEQRLKHSDLTTEQIKRLFKEVCDD